MNTQKSGRLWWTLLAAPFLALVLIVLASVYFGFVTQGKDPAAIPQLVADSTPYELVALQIWLLLILMKTMKREGLSWKDIGWKLQDGQQLWREILIGAIPGIVIALLYFFVLTPVLLSLIHI